MQRFQISTEKKEGVIAPELHSHFIEFLGSCIYDGIWVGEDSEIPNVHGFRRAIVEAMERIHPPVIRWPGGCYADTYHWRDGIGDRRRRPVRYNENFGTFELDSNRFGTHEFMEFCELVGAKAWLNVNLMTGSPAEMREWAEYCNRSEPTALTQERADNGHPEPFGAALWGIGNECWAGGGNYTAQGYAAEYRKYATAMPRNAALTGDARSYLIAGGPDGNKPKERVKWTKEFFRGLAEYRMPQLDAWDLHFYNWNLPNRTPGEWSGEDWDRVVAGSLEIEPVILEQAELIRQGLEGIPEAEGFFPSQAPSCDLVVGEWGNWHGYAFAARPALYQESTVLDAVTSALTLDVFHRNCGVVKLACVAQSVNVLNSLFLTSGEKTVLSPVYHVFDLYQVHRGAEKVGLTEEKEEPSGAVHAFASVKGDRLYLNLVQTDPETERTVEIKADRKLNWESTRLIRREGLSDRNTFEEPDRIRIVEGGRPEEREGGLRIMLPPASVSVYTFRLR